MAKTASRVDTDDLSRRITRTPFPGSRKTYLGDLRVPFREIALTDTLLHDGQHEANPPLRVYDASGPYTDPDAAIDITRGLPALRGASGRDPCARRWRPTRRCRDRWCRRRAPAVRPGWTA